MNLELEAFPGELTALRSQIHELRQDNFRLKQDYSLALTRWKEACEREDKAIEEREAYKAMLQAQEDPPCSDSLG